MFCLKEYTSQTQTPNRDSVDRNLDDNALRSEYQQHEKIHMQLGISIEQFVKYRRDEIEKAELATNVLQFENKSPGSKTDRRGTKRTDPRVDDIAFLLSDYLARREQLTA